jgi:hypothetical protein
MLLFSILFASVIVRSFGSGVSGSKGRVTGTEFLFSGEETVFFRRILRFSVVLFCLTCLTYFLLVLPVLKKASPLSDEEVPSEAVVPATTGFGAIGRNLSIILSMVDISCAPVAFLTMQQPPLPSIMLSLSLMSYCFLFLSFFGVATCKGKVMKKWN